MVSSLPVCITGSLTVDQAALMQTAVARPTLSQSALT